MSAAPDWSKNEESLQQAKDYLREGNTVDFFENIAASLLRDQPKDVAVYTKNLVAEALAGKSAKKEGDFKAKEEDDNAYMRTHNVSDFLDRWVLALLNARPVTDADRMAFHAKYLEQVVADLSQ